MDKSKAKQYLEEVKRIKSEHYVGTQEAFAYIRGKEGAKASFRDTADAVNKALPESSSYKATPQRIVAFDNVLRALTAEIMQTDIPYSEKEKVAANFDEDYADASEEHFATSPKSARQRLAVEIFSHAVEQGITNDEAFAEYLKNEGRTHLLNTYVPVELHAEIESVRPGIESLHGLSDQLTSFDHAYQNEIEGTARMRFGLQCDLNGGIVARLINDRVAHREPYRKQLVERIVGSRLRTGLSPELQYQKAIDEYNELLKKIQKRFTHLKNLNAPLVILENEERLLRDAKYMRHALGAEKNYTIKRIKEEMEKRGKEE